MTKFYEVEQVRTKAKLIWKFGIRVLEGFNRYNALSIKSGEAVIIAVVNNEHGFTYAKDVSDIEDFLSLTDRTNDTLFFALYATKKTDIASYNSIIVKEESFIDFTQGQGEETEIETFLSGLGTSADITE